MRYRLTDRLPDLPDDRPVIRRRWPPDEESPIPDAGDRDTDDEEDEDDVFDD